MAGNIDFAQGRLTRIPSALTLAASLVLVLPVGCSPNQGPRTEQASAELESVKTSEVAAANRDEAAIPSPAWPEVKGNATVPEWAVDAVFYQVFPERFRNGDSSNDPTRESLEFPDTVAENWAITPWTGDWYARADWEQADGDNFYEHGVFNRRYGGDLQGILDGLDYLQSLGVNTLYLNPVFYARSLHKYDGASMHHIDPYFGPDPAGDFALMAKETSAPETWQWTAADKLFLKLIADLHQREMRIIIDGVFNHTGRDFFAFADLMKNQKKSPYKEWYIVSTFDDPETPGDEFKYKGWWGVHTLPEFTDIHQGADLHPGPKQYVMDITSRWMDPNGDGDPSDGIDGWRLDVANEVPIAFWKDWNAHVRQLNGAAYTVAEHWEDAAQFLAEGGFSATMNYHAFAFPVKGFLIDGQLSAHDFARELTLRRQDFPPATSFVLQNLIDSHDTNRLASMIVNRPDYEKAQPYLQPHKFDYDVSERVSPRYWKECNVQAPNAEERKIQRLVVLMQMTYVGAPMIYYGDEAGMWGADDPCDRMPMVWQDMTFEDQSHDPLNRQRTPDPVSFAQGLFDFYQQAISLRSELPVLRRGSIAKVLTDDDAQVYVFQRKLGDRQVIIAINRGAEAFTVTLPEVSESKWEVKLTTGFEGDESPQKEFTLPAHEGVVLYR
ncbi:glycoside hydrolase family 13 protein [Adhaeretor mobilis]|uniref:glycoside hydrolase family 13 protein n=1 Tax=Adhaeretor mobilis TaxID=1930276 RepID=UPI001C54DF97|nr:glycoside hydrolase family 13 protein [Adhaeretor mobilis]